MKAILRTDFKLPGQTGFYRGKVRDVYYLHERLIIVATDRISAFDHILPEPIPGKGRVLNQIAALFLNATEDIVPNWLEAVPDPNVSVGRLCEPIRVEMVIRGYLAGHAWREYSSGKRVLCGVQMPEGLKESDPFPEPVITPATKAETGHDEDISAEEILQRGLATEQQYLEMERITRELFARGSRMARDRGLILVDTKYEFGLLDGQICLMDEIHTPDSSRYFYLEGYNERQQRGEPQWQLSKEFVREWLMEHGFRGLEGQKMPEMPDDFVEHVSNRYRELYEIMTGETFLPDDSGDIVERIETNILGYLKGLEE